ncbi:MAG: ribosomal-processing cysteine protease Prp [Tannerella sp.]|jgi:uncharacterized protein YsxB (DUF464 family)|nr:ribosomal-processing cysteine protease Prp [Tannerella sp.]
MIAVEIVLDNDLLKLCRIKGHARSGGKGNDIVCAAVSALARAAAAALAGEDGIAVRCEAKKPGEFFLEIAECAEAKKSFLSGVGTFLRIGLDSVAREYPKQCRLSVNTVM